MRFNLRRFGLIGTLAMVTALVVAACGGGGDPTAEPGAPQPQAPLPTATAAPTATLEAAATVAPAPTAKPTPVPRVTLAPPIVRALGGRPGLCRRLERLPWLRSHLLAAVTKERAP